MIYPNLLQALILTVWFFGMYNETARLFQPAPIPAPGAFIPVRRDWSGKIYGA